MAIYHCSLQNISRAAGRSAIAAAAYRSTSRIVDRKTGIASDYTRKERALAAGIELPAGAPEWAGNRAELWNRAEEKENRKNSILAHEINIAIPCEIKNQADREKLVREYAKTITAQGAACDWAIHAPDGKGDRRNYHAHLMFTTRTFEGGDWAKNKPHRTKDEASEWVERHRKNWETCANRALAELHKRPRIDRRSLEAQGIGRTPQQHQGVTATQMERRGAKPDRTRTRPGAKEYISELYGHIEEIKKFLMAKLSELGKLPERTIREREYRAVQPRKAYNAAAIVAQIEQEQGYRTEQNRKTIDEWKREKQTPPPREPKREKTEAVRAETVKKTPETERSAEPAPPKREAAKPEITRTPETKPKAATRETARKPDAKKPETIRKPETREEAIARIADSLKTKTMKELAELKAGIRDSAEREARTVAAIPFIEKDISEKRNAAGREIAGLGNDEPGKVAEKGKGFKPFAVWKDDSGKLHISHKEYAAAQQAIAYRWKENIRQAIDERDRLAETADAMERAKAGYRRAPDAKAREAALEPVRRYLEGARQDYTARQEVRTAAAERLKEAPEFEGYRRSLAAIGAAEAERRSEITARNRERRREERQRGVERDGWER
jgi:hypothetical protein